MFAGRVAELKEIDAALNQTKNLNPRHFLIHGERGIGKSSLMLIADRIAKGIIQGFDSGNQYRFLTVNVEISPSMSLVDLVSSIETELQNEINLKQQTVTFFQNVWEFAKKWEICGTKFNDSKTQPISVVPELVRKCASICQTLQFNSDGIIILIDEADNACDDTQLGQFIKVFTERLTKQGCNNVAIGISGISSVYDILNKSHESAVRILNSQKLETLEPHERIEVIRMGLSEADKKGDKVSITAEAENWIAKYSEGFLHLKQIMIKTSTLKMLLAAHIEKMAHWIS